MQIAEKHFDTFERKIKAIISKCQKYGTEFTYNVTGAAFEKVTLEHGKSCIVKFYNVEVDGKVHFADWELIAKIESVEGGNIIRSLVSVPEIYRTSELTCEHCNIARSRSKTYLIKHISTGEYKQVGKSCLSLYTGSTDAVKVADYYNGLLELLEESTKSENLLGGKTYFDLTNLLCSFIVCVDKDGYIKTDQVKSTRFEGIKYYNENERSFTFSGEVKTLAQNILEWLANQEAGSDFIHNLQLIAKQDCVEIKNTGFLASLYPTYLKAMEREDFLKAKSLENADSVHVGSVGDRIIVQISASRCITSWDTEYGVTKLYEFKDAAGNIYTWKTSNSIYGERNEEPVTITGRVKAHNVYNNINQTELTRCKVTH
jgi:hypothetical protein